MEVYDLPYHVNLLCNAFELSTSIQFILLQKNNLIDVIVELIIITRKVNNIITFYDIQKFISINNFDQMLILTKLSNHNNYIEFKTENIINRYLFDLNISYKESCIAKYIMTCFDDMDYILVCVFSILLTLRLINRNDTIKDVLVVFNRVGWPGKKVNKIDVIIFLNNNKKKRFIKKDIKNTFARQIIQKHLWDTNWLETHNIE
jgi:hypothetical protein